MSLSNDDLLKIAEVVEKVIEAKSFATKEDLKGFATKEDIVVLRQDIAVLREDTVKYSDIAELFEAFEEKLKTEIFSELNVIKEHLNLV